MRMTPLLACAAAFAAAAPALAAGFASPEEIDSAVAEFTGAAIGTEGGARLPIDRHAVPPGRGARRRCGRRMDPRAARRHAFRAGEGARP